MRPLHRPPSRSRFLPVAAELTVGFSQIGSESGWRAAETTVTKQEAAKRKVNLKIADAQQKQENQIKAIRSFIAQGVDAIFLAPVVATRLGRGAEGSQGSQDSRWSCSTATSIRRQGPLSDRRHLRQRRMKARSPATGWRRRSATRPATSSNCRARSAPASPTNRKKGFDSAIAKHANLKIVRSQTGDFTRAKGKEVMESFIKAEGGGKTICAVYAHNDDMMVGAIQAIKEAGLKPGKDILTVSIDAVPDIFKAMAAGEANATVELTPNMAGPALRRAHRLQGQGHGAAEVDPDRIQALHAGRRSEKVYDSKKGLGY